MPVSLIPEQRFVSVMRDNVVNDRGLELTTVSLTGDAPGMVSEVDLALFVPPRTV